MNSVHKVMFLFLVQILISCNNKTNEEVNYHSSHEKSSVNAPFSDAVQVDNLFFLSGQIGKNHKTGKLVAGGIEFETRQAILNIEAVLKHHHLSLNNVVKCTVILANIEDFSKMNKVYRSFFMVNLPARTTFAADLVGGAQIEIEVVAVKQ